MIRRGRERLKRRIDTAELTRLKPIRLLPSLITTASLSCGLMAIFYMVRKNDDSVVACWLIILAAFLDVMDGAVARLTNSASDFGVQFDSLADAIVFGATPSILMFLHLGGDSEFVRYKFAQFACMLFTICGVLRLARFNTAAGKSTKKSFTGMPIPGAAATVVSAYLVFRGSDSSWVIQILPWLMLYLALMMVSTFEYQSLKSIDFDAPRPFEALLPLIALIAAGFVFKKHIWEYFEWIVFIGMLLYALSGPALYLAGLTSANEPDPDAAAEPNASDRENPAETPGGAEVREIADTDGEEPEAASSA
jgi:CDP-diacylglycerol--serine O-phosphatidyltransferase